eukprot:TRINITY_DN1573_c0_g1_i1.p1 TRINITY_DN1573_c0_g1~~TRINITY_DN1573_c0_g1_i1.p1  ORF type:complete len:119 (+),score=8.43 TRINITY_DN1573_c0_g1_i1:3-359(+)
MSDDWNAHQIHAIRSVYELLLKLPEGERMPSVDVATRIHAAMLRNQPNSKFVPLLQQVTIIQDGVRLELFPLSWVRPLENNVGSFLALRDGFIDTYRVAGAELADEDWVRVRDEEGWS